MQYILDRLRERTTWLGIIALLGAAGVQIKPELVEPIVAFGGALFGLIVVLFPEDGKLTPPPGQIAE